MKQKTALVFFVAVFSLPLSGQELDSLATSRNKIIDLGYVDSKQDQFAGSVRSIETQDFNEGNINDPLLLIRNRVAGLGVYKKGSNPNERPHMRIRGLSTINGKSEPLIVIDGVIGASLDNIDPQDIATFTILKSAAATALYGMRAGSGVILLSTKSGENKEGFSANYRSYVATATLSNPLPNLNAEEYVEAGGNDQSSNTNWLDEVSRTGISQVHNLSVGGSNGSTSYRISLNARSIDGILNKSGFDQINTRANLFHRAMNDRLKLSFNLSLTQRESQYSFNEAFRYASIFNPTAPVRFETGGFWQPILFDNYNPVAVIELNENDGKNKLLNYHFAGSYEISEGLSVHANFAQQYLNEFNGEFYHSQSFFRGLNRDGIASRSWRDQQLTQFESFVNFQPDWASRFKWTLTAGYSYTQQFEESLLMEFSNLATNDLGYYGIDLSGSRVTGGVEDIIVKADASPVERIIGFFGQTQLTPLKGIDLSLSLRRDGSTRLGKNNRWSTFYALGTNVDMLQYLPIKSLSALNIRLDQGVTGNLPYTYGLAQSRYDYLFYEGGSVEDRRLGNDVLTNERNQSTNIGLDLSLPNDRITLTIDRYWRESDDLISTIQIERVDHSISQIQNNAGLNTKGLDLSMQIKVMQTGTISWNSQLFLSHYRTSLSKFNEALFLTASPGSPCGCSTFLTRVAVGEQIGQFWTRVFEGVDENGYPTFKDINGDGEVISQYGFHFDENSDFETSGVGMPTVEYGWSHQVLFKGFDLNVLFRGALGHSLVNSFRRAYEPLNPGSINSYNRVVTDKTVADLAVPLMSSLYVERADFLRLDNLTIGYTFQTDPLPAVNHLRVFTTVENAFTLTNYTGTDPDPVMRDFGPTGHGSYSFDLSSPNNFAPGIDRRTFYYTARTFLLGLEAKF